MQTSPLLFACLGNPGTKYALTRHNIGFMFADYIVGKYALSPFAYEKKFLGFISISNFNSKKIIFVKPDTYMNLSGDCIQRIAPYYNVEYDSLFAVHDDLDFPFLTHKIRKGGSAGGHNGIASMIHMLGTADFYRFRLGIGRPPQQMDTKDYVLQRFSAEELGQMEKIWAPQWEEMFGALVREGITSVMNKFNKKG